MPNLCRSLLLLLIVAPFATLSAQESYFRIYDDDAGFSSGEIKALAQDETGFIWIGTQRGLIRFDGRNFVPWAADRLTDPVAPLGLVRGANDELLIRTRSGRSWRLWRRTRDSVEPVSGPDGKPIENSIALAFDARGDLWTVLGKELWRRDRTAQWQHAGQGIPATEKFRGLRAAGQSMIAVTDEAIWRLRDTATAELVLRGGVFDRVAGDDDVVWLSKRTGTDVDIWRVDAQGARQIADLGRYQYVRDMALRGSTLWIVTSGLIALEANGHIRRLNVNATILPTGGPILLDRESSLWLGTSVGLIQFPEPDTWNWLPNNNLKRFWQAGDTTWVQGDPRNILRIETATGAVVREQLDADLCIQPPDHIWAVSESKVYAWRGSTFKDGAFEPVADMPAGTEFVNACRVDASGTLWIYTVKDLLRLAPGASHPAPIHTVDAQYAAVLGFDDRDDRPLASVDGRVCRLRVFPDDHATAEDCVAGDGLRTVQSVQRVDAQHIWLVGVGGVHALDARNELRFLPGNRSIGGGEVSSTAPAQNGEVWLSHGQPVRVRPCADCEDGWRITERPSAWHGLPDNSTNYTLETAEGDLWTSGFHGIWRVPKAVRSRPLVTPRTVLVRSQVDADLRDPNVPLQLKPSDRRLELEFASLSYRDRNLLRYHSRIAGEGNWSLPMRDPRLQFAALEPGAYRVEMSASLDGEHWSDPPASVEFSVLPPWYRTWWAQTLFGLAALSLIVLIYRLRVAALLRVESERTRIALDLHDEIGAGLGSIGMLAGAAARTRADTDEQTRIVREIGNVAGLLSNGLRSLVWSLRSDKAGLAELGEQIADHAHRLFPDEAPRLSLALPGPGQGVSLPVEVRRHVLLFAFEALHNASRHARARSVEVRLQANSGKGFTLGVRDDGVGFDLDQDSPGNGVESMRRRAKAIGAQLEITSAPGAGTDIELTWPDTARHA
jgi:signal transduction histidine kinase/ligand-binding sensor domain-containing protein